MKPSAASAPAPGRTGIVVPLYSYPGETWSALVQLKMAHPMVPVVAIINPYNGPGVDLDRKYVAGIEQLQKAGIVVLGYDHTSYSARAAPTVKGDMDRYHAWYPTIDGIFFDEMANAEGCESYYASLSAYARSIGFRYTMGNPGTSVPSSYVGTMDYTVIYESPGAPSISTLSSLVRGMDKSKFVMIAYAVQDFSPSYANSASTHVGHLYITDMGAEGSNPYSSLPSYLSVLMDALDGKSP